MFRTHIRGMRNVAQSGSLQESRSLSYTPICRPQSLRCPLARRTAHRDVARIHGTCALMDQSWSYGALRVRNVAAPGNEDHSADALVEWMNRARLTERCEFHE